MYIKGLEMLICWQNFSQEISCQWGRKKYDKNHRNVYRTFHLNPKYALGFVLIFYFVDKSSISGYSKLSLMPATLCTRNYFTWPLPSSACVWEAGKTNCNWSKKCTHNGFFSFPPHAEIAKANNNLVSFAHCISLGWPYDSVIAKQRF